MTRPSTAGGNRAPSSSIYRKSAPWAPFPSSCPIFPTRVGGGLTVSRRHVLSLAHQGRLVCPTCGRVPRVWGHGHVPVEPWPAIRSVVTGDRWHRARNRQIFRLFTKRLFSEIVRFFGYLQNDYSPKSSDFSAIYKTIIFRNRQSFRLFTERLFSEIVGFFGHLQFDYSPRLTKSTIIMTRRGIVIYRVNEKWQTLNPGRWYFPS